MPKKEEIRSRDEITESIAMTIDLMEKNMPKFSKLFPDFSLEWLQSVDANYKSFLNYILLATKTHIKEKGSK